MEKWIAILIVIGISIIGIINTILVLRSLLKNKDFTIGYINQYREFGNELFKGQMKEDIYEWLRLKSSKMQNLMGSYGIASMFQPPFSNIMYRNYHIVYNGLTEIRKEFSVVQPKVSFGGGLSYQNLHELVRMIDDCLISYVGALEDKEQDIISQLKNPTIWFREGIRFFIVLPLSIIRWSGLIKYHTYNRLSDNFLVKIITMLVALIGLVSSIITIISGYDTLMGIYDEIKNMPYF